MHPHFASAGNKLRNKYYSIPPKTRKRARNIIIIILLILIFRGRITGAIRRLIHRDISKIDVNIAKLSYLRGEYYSMCSTLEAAMNGWGTNEDSIYEVIMRLNTQDDWNYLQKCFGIRKKDGGTFLPDITGDLKAWLVDDLSSGELKKVRDILRQRGINY